MNLSNFESYIDSVILARGYDYFDNDYVIAVEETDDNVYEAEVEGTERYNVEVELDEATNIMKTQCDCPYDMGEYCKHQVAVFLALRAVKINNSTRNTHLSQNNINSGLALKSSVLMRGKARDIDKILSGRTKDELVEFLLEIASEYEEIKQRIELNFDNANDEDEIIKSIKMIRTFVRKSSDRYGFVAYGNTDEAVRGATLVLKKARCACGHSKALHALDLTLCVIHEFMDLLGNCDDSDGVVGETIEESFALINEIIVTGELVQADKERFFNILIEESANTRYEGWADWRLNLLDSCSALANTPSLRNRLENNLVSMIEAAEGDSWNVGYFTERVNQIRYNMIRQHEGEKQAQEFIEENLNYPSFRKMAIESAMERKDYALATNLALDGETKDKNLLGLVNDWKQYRYQAFRLSGKLDEQRELARDFIMDGSFEHYKELKNTYSPEEWVGVYSTIIFSLENQKKNTKDVYTRILIEERETQKLLEYVKRRPDTVEIYYKHLISEFKEEVYAVFLQYIEQVAARAGNRRDYQGVCAIIRNLKKAGGKAQSQEIKQTLFAKYANRPAFRDELTKI